MASSIVYRCWPTENNDARATEVLDSLSRYPIYVTSHESLIKVLIDYLSAMTDYDENKIRNEMREDIHFHLNILERNYAGRYTALTVNRIQATLKFREFRFNLYLEIAGLY